MPTPAVILKRVSALMNDVGESAYGPDECLPYFNIALDDLQEEFELNNIPVTSLTTSPILQVPANTDAIAFTGTTPVLPANLIEIRQLWESPQGQNNWIPITKRNYLPHYLEGDQISQFLIWAWLENQIRVLPANQPIDLKLDYIKSLFVEVPLDAIGIDLGVELKNTTSYLSYRTAALCSYFIGENESRAIALNDEAGKALGRSMGISIKGLQSFAVRRRPFRASYKRRTTY